MKVTNQMNLGNLEKEVPKEPIDCLLQCHCYNLFSLMLKIVRHFQKISTLIFNPKQQRLTYQLNDVDVLELLAQLKIKEQIFEWKRSRL